MSLTGYGNVSDYDYIDKSDYDTSSKFSGTFSSLF
ncbi:hypothetical protein T02_6438 [Trichinella nativa]|uniref:Uncharacterized protein n=1 Tax=Trichinella nativa TaxID=6335 RepID=A0A0V1KII3_9BILA|nr:hypothetical protein T02_6438 [Trichinella nativa]